MTRRAISSGRAASSVPIVTEGLVKRYGRHRALDGFSLSVPAGSVTGLVGRNGAGKTTWMMTVAGFVRPQAGTVDLFGTGPFDAARHGGRLAILPQDSDLPPEARPFELLVRYARLQGLPARAAARNAAELLDTFNLGAQAKKPIRALSHGMRKRVMVAQAFIGAPEAVLLDEPLSGLDPVEADRMRAFLRSRRGRQTIVISSHHLDDVEKLCTHVAFVADGRLERFDSLAALTAEAGRFLYRLRRRPDDLAALEAALPGLSLAWRDDTGALEATGAAAEAPESVNARVLPHLLPFGVLSVSSGRSLEEAYLRRDGRPSSSPRETV